MTENTPQIKARLRPLLKNKISLLLKVALNLYVLRQQQWHRKLRIFAKRTILAQVDDYELQDYRLTREIITEVIKGFEVSVFSNKCQCSHALTSKTQLSYISIIKLSMRCTVNGGEHKLIYEIIVMFSIPF